MRNSDLGLRGTVSSHDLAGMGLMKICLDLPLLLLLSSCQGSLLAKSTQEPWLRWSAPRAESRVREEGGDGIHPGGQMEDTSRPPQQPP